MAHRSRQRARAETIEFGVHIFQAADQVEHLAARVGASGGLTEMRATAERPVGVDRAFGRLRVQKRTRAIRAFRPRPNPL